MAHGSGRPGAAGPAIRRPPVARIALGLLMVAAALALGRALGGRLPELAARIEGLGVWGPIVFIGGYAAATIALAPGSILTLAAGALFGLGRGVGYALLGATLGASGAFVVARYLARDAVERRLGANPRLAAIDRAIAARGLRIVLLLRLSPVFPFNLLNYALGLTRVRFADYLLASAGMIPGTFLYVYYGKLLGDVAALAGGAPVRRDAAYYALLSVGLLATVAVTALVTRIARRALTEAIPEALAPGAPPREAEPASPGAPAGRRPG